MLLHSLHVVSPLQRYICQKACLLAVATEEGSIASLLMSFPEDYMSVDPILTYFFGRIHVCIRYNSTFCCLHHRVSEREDELGIHFLWNVSTPVVFPSFLPSYSLCSPLSLRLPFLLTTRFEARRIGRKKAALPSWEAGRGLCRGWPAIDDNSAAGA